MMTTDIILFGILFVNTLIFLVLVIPQISNGSRNKTNIKVSYANMQSSLQEPQQIKLKSNKFSLRKKEPDDFYEKLMAESNEVKS
jgi:hypothetical protein